MVVRIALHTKRRGLSSYCHRATTVSVMDLKYCYLIGVWLMKSLRGFWPGSMLYILVVYCHCFWQAQVCIDL